VKRSRTGASGKLGSAVTGSPLLHTFVYRVNLHCDVKARCDLMHAYSRAQLPRSMLYCAASSILEVCATPRLCIFFAIVAKRKPAFGASCRSFVGKLAQHDCLLNVGPRQVTYADLGGIDNVLSDIKELIEHPLQHPEVTCTITHTKLCERSFGCTFVG
jgi:hypothetical protein